MVPAGAGGQLTRQLRMAEHRRQDVVEVVGDPAGELPHGLELLGVPQLPLEGQLLGDVLRDHRVVHRPAQLVADGRDGGARGELAPVGALARDLAAPGLAASQTRPDLVGGPVAVAQEDRCRLAEDLRPRPSGHPLVGRIHVDDHAVGVGDDDHLLGLLDDPGQQGPLLRVAFPVGDVHGDRAEQRGTVPRFQREEGGLEAAGVAAGADGVVDLDRVGGRRGALDASLEGGREVGRQEVGEPAADDLLGGPPQRRADRLVDVEVAAIASEERRGVGRVVEERIEPLPVLLGGRALPLEVAEEGLQRRDQGRPHQGQVDERVGEELQDVTGHVQRPVEVDVQREGQFGADGQHDGRQQGVSEGPPEPLASPEEQHRRRGQDAADGPLRDELEPRQPLARHVAIGHHRPDQHRGREQAGQHPDAGEPRPRPHPHARQQGKREQAGRLQPPGGDPQLGGRVGFPAGGEQPHALVAQRVGEIEGGHAEVGRGQELQRGVVTGVARVPHQQEDAGGDHDRPQLHRRVEHQEVDPREQERPDHQQRDGEARQHPPSPRMSAHRIGGHGGPSLSSRCRDPRHLHSGGVDAPQCSMERPRQ